MAEEQKPKWFSPEWNKAKAQGAKTMAKNTAKAAPKAIAKGLGKGALGLAKLSVVGTASIISPIVRDKLDDLGLGGVAKAYDYSKVKASAGVSSWQRKREQKKREAKRARERAEREERKKAAEEVTKKEGEDTTADAKVDENAANKPDGPDTTDLTSQIAAATAADRTLSSSINTAEEAKIGPEPETKPKTKPKSKSKSKKASEAPEAVDPTQISRAVPAAVAAAAVDVDAATEPAKPKKATTRKKKEAVEKTEEQITEIRAKNLATIKAVAEKRAAEPVTPPVKARKPRTSAKGMTKALSTALTDMQSPDASGGGSDMTPVIDKLGGILSVLQKMETAATTMSDAFKEMVKVQTESIGLQKELISKIDSLGQRSSADDALDRARAGRVRGAGGRPVGLSSKDGSGDGLGMGMMSTIMEIIKNSAIVAALIGLKSSVSALAGMIGKFIGAKAIMDMFTGKSSKDGPDVPGKNKKAPASPVNKPKLGAGGRTAMTTAFLASLSPDVELFETEEDRIKGVETIKKLKEEESKNSVTSETIRNGFGMAGAFFGSVFGGSLGSAGGPLGTVAGGVAGSYAGEAAGHGAFDAGVAGYNHVFVDDSKDKQARPFVTPGGYTGMRPPADKTAAKEYFEMKQKERQQSSAPVAIDASTTNVNNMGGGGGGARSSGQHPAGSASPALNIMERKLMGMGIPLVP